MVAELGGHYGRVVLDCPPAYSLLVRGVWAAVDALVVPTIPTPLSLRSLATLHAELKPRRREGLLVLPFFSMVDQRKAIHRRVVAFARAEGLGFLATEIPHSAHVEGSAARREPLTASSARQSPGAASSVAAFEALHREIEEHLAADSRPPKLGRERLERFVQELRHGAPTGVASRANPGPSASNGS
jgi:cellulose biosynthesis protein BcsQ